MIPLLLAAGLVAVLATLLVVRARDTHHGPGGGSRVGRTLLAVAALLALAAPLPAAQRLFGVGLPDRCLAKPEESEASLVDSDLLRTEVRERRRPGLPPAVELRGAQRVQRLTGPASPVRTDRRWAVFGTDLGHPFRHDGRLGLLFGDTFATEARSGWRSNVLAWSDADPTDGLQLTAMHGPPGVAHEILGSMKLIGWEQTVIPTNAVSVDGRIVAHYMSVKCWGIPGDWVVNHAGLAVSRDGGRRWHRVGVRWRGDGPFAQVAFAHRGADVYAFGIPAGRTGAVHLARAPAAELTHPGAWRYRTARGWSPDPARATPLVPAPVGELSVRWLPHHDAWLMLYLDERRRGVVMRTAARLTGPWSAERLVVSEATVPSLYAPYLLPVSTGPDEIYFTLSRFDTYNVQLMRARVVRPAAPHPGMVSAE